MCADRWPYHANCLAMHEEKREKGAKKALLQIPTVCNRCSAALSADRSGHFHAAQVAQTEQFLSSTHHIVCKWTNLESETSRESATKNQKLNPANQKLKSANQKPKSHESETKSANKKLKYRNQIQNPVNQKLRIRKLKIANQTPRSANQKPNKPTNQKLKKANLKPNLPPPLNILLNEILPPTYPHKGSNPPPPLNTMLKRMLHLFVFSPWGIKSATPFWPSCRMRYCLQHIPIPDQIRHPLWSLCWMGYDLQLIFIRHQIRHPLWPLSWMRYYLQLIHIWDQIRHPLWPLCWMRYYLQSVVIRDQIRQCWMRYYLQLLFVRYQTPPPPLNTLLNGILPSTCLHKKSNPATPSGHYVEWDITFNLSTYEMKSGTPSDHYVEWDITFKVSS